MNFAKHILMGAAAMLTLPAAADEGGVPFWCLMKELEFGGLTTLSQRSVVVNYKGFTREEPLRFDLLVEGCLLVEAKAVAEVLPIHKAQVLSYMKLLDVPVGLLINFHAMKLTDGVHRLILRGAKQMNNPLYRSRLRERR